MADRQASPGLRLVGYDWKLAQARNGGECGEACSCCSGSIFVACGERFLTGDDDPRYMAKPVPGTRALPGHAENAPRSVLGRPGVAGRWPAGGRCRVVAS